MKRPTVPCRDCDRRTMTCHAVCKEYKTFVEQNELYNAEAREAKGRYALLPNIVRQIERSVKR